ncbi:hypothetical protein P8813_22110, partial [Bacillus velezensis]|uniref:hypothetical protein n=1 Tax=Bacillus velezensis TaxID=492670 RepID=UPI002DBF5B7E
LKELRGRRFRCGAGRRTSEGENAPRLRSDQGCTGSASAVKSPRLIETARQQDSGTGRVPAFCVQGR